MEDGNGKKSFYRDTVEEMGPDGYSLEDPMTFWNEEKNSLWKKIWGRSETPFVMMGVGLLLILVIFFVVYPGGVDQDTNPEGGALAERLQLVENKIAALMSDEEGLVRVQQDIGSLKESILRFDAADASETLRMDRMAEDLATIKREIEAIKKKISSDQVEKTKSVSRAVTHEVQKGDTLFSISRQYGVSVETIRKLNKLSTNAIQLGQELKVKE